MEKQYDGPKQTSNKFLDHMDLQHRSQNEKPDMVCHLTNYYQLLY